MSHVLFLGVMCLENHWMAFWAKNCYRILYGWLVRWLVGCLVGWLLDCLLAGLLIWLLGRMV